MGADELLRSVLRRLAGRLRGEHRYARPWQRVFRDHASAWRGAREAAPGGPRVLLATSLGGYDHGAMLESVLAAALTLRGAEVDVLLCDAALPACQLTKHAKIAPETLVEHGQRRLCDTCVPMGRALFSPTGLRIHWIGELITPREAAQARAVAANLPAAGVGDWTLADLAVGEHALAGALRYFGRGDLRDEPLGEAVLGRYVEAALRTVYALRRLLERERYDVACFHHGIYVPQGLIGEVCRAAGLRVVNWNPAYRKQTFVFSHGDTYHHTMISEPTSTWEHLQWGPELEERTLAYLKSRWQGSEDWIWFHEDPKDRLDEIARELGVDFSRPCVGMLSSVMWDAQLHYRSNAFPNMLAWVGYTIDYFRNRPDLQLIIRVHPAEVRGMIPSRQPLAAEIARDYPRLPPNIVVIPPESRVSTYAVLAQCNAAIIFNTKTGIELASTGVPVIVAGEAWIRGKGFSLDASNPQEYRALLDRLPWPGHLPAEQLERARKYAFHFFFRRMIPIPFVESPERFRFAVKVRELDALLPGRAPGLDVVCEGILTGAPFVYPAETLPC